jgi:hypothetical protein
MHTLASKQVVIHQVGQIYTAQLYIHMMIQHMHVSCNNETRSELQHPHERLLTANIMCTGWDEPQSLHKQILSPGLVPPILPKFHYTKRKFSITSKCRQMHGVLNVDEIKN